MRFLRAFEVRAAACSSIRAVRGSASNHRPGEDSMVLCKYSVFPQPGWPISTLIKVKPMKTKRRKIAFAACLYKRSANVISLVHDRDSRSRYLPTHDEGGMANPLAGERWRSRHDGVRQCPSSGPLWDRGGLRSVVRSHLTARQGDDAARASRAKALGRDPRAAFDL